MKYIGDTEKLDIQSAKILSNQGIDVFNAADDFFNDICYQYDSHDNKDIILNDRRNDIYQNVTFCEDGCIYNGMNYTLLTANCICKSNIVQEEKNNILENRTNAEKINFKTLSKIFKENIFNFNFEVLRCYNLVLNKKILIHNIGFFCLSLMFILQIVFTFVYLINKLNSIKIFMEKFDNNNKKKKKYWKC